MNPNTKLLSTHFNDCNMLIDAVRGPNSEHQDSEGAVLSSAWSTDYLKNVPRSSKLCE